MGFNSKRYFYYSIGTPLSLLLLSFILIYGAKILLKINRTISISFFVIGLSNLITSLFFINWSLFKEIDYKIGYYYWGIFVVSFLVLTSSILYYFFYNTLFYKLSLVTTFLIKTRSYHFKKIATKALVAEKMKNHPKSNKNTTIPENINKFDFEFWNVLKNIVK